MNRERLLERFLRYVRVHTTANDDTTEYPSSAGQWELGRLLAAEMEEMGLQQVRQDDHGLVWGTVPGNADAPVIAFNAHLDTSPETSGQNVQPQVVSSYAGGDIVLPGDSTKVISVADNPELNDLHGSTLITTDGTTLLGADDKAGIAIILEAAQWLLEHPEIPHGEIRIVFTCDEEIGRGTQHLDVQDVGAVAAYTLDGSGANQLDVETFSADAALVRIRGINIHPSIAKDRMVNAVRAAGTFLDALPRDTLAPEATCQREGFLHPYLIEGGVDEVRLRVLLRDFDTSRLEQHAALLRRVATQVEEQFPGLAIEIEVTRQYRNLGDGLTKEPRAVDYAVRAHQRLGREAKLSIVRGGTDGSLMTELGLPTPNLSSGQHAQHSPLEWACLDEMVQAGEVVLEIARVWQELG